MIDGTATALAKTVVFRIELSLPIDINDGSNVKPDANSAAAIPHKIMVFVTATVSGPNNSRR